jgi:hypothetical protein
MFCAGIARGGVRLSESRRARSAHGILRGHHHRWRCRRRDRHGARLHAMRGVAVQAEPSANAAVRLPILVGEPVPHAVHPQRGVLRDGVLETGQRIHAIAVEEVRFRGDAGATAKEHGQLSRLHRRPDQPAREQADVDAREPIRATRTHLGVLELRRPAWVEVHADAAAPAEACLEAEGLIERRRAAEGAELHRPSLLGGERHGADHRRNAHHDCLDRHMTLL